MSQLYPNKDPPLKSYEQTFTQLIYEGDFEKDPVVKAFLTQVVDQKSGVGDILQLNDFLHNLEEEALRRMKEKYAKLYNIKIFVEQWTNLCDNVETETKRHLLAQQLIQLLSPAGTTHFPSPPIVDEILPLKISEWISRYPSFQKYREELEILCRYLNRRKFGRMHGKFNNRILERILGHNGDEEILRCREFLVLLEQAGYIISGRNHQFSLTSQGEELYKQVCNELSRWRLYSKEHP